MGAGLSQDQENQEPLTEEQLNAIFAKPLDPKSAFAAAFAGDSHAVAEIERIVKLLEQAPNPARDRQLRQQAREAHKKLQVLKQLAAEGNETAIVLLDKLQKALGAEKEQERAELRAERQGNEAADDWLKEQVEEGKRLAEDVEAEQSAKAAAKVAADERSALEEAARKTAKAEMEAREELRKTASEAAMARLEDAEISARHAKLRLEGLKALIAPRKPPTPGSGEAADLPEAPSMPSQPSQAEKKKRREGPIPEFYVLLEVDVDATFEEIKKGYRRQALKWHPDKNRDKPQEASERFKKISEAFDTLYDPEKRERYDSGQWDKMPKSRVKKLQGHGWASVGDEDDAALTPIGLRYKKKSWEGYVFYGGRIDDDENDLIWEESDPRLPLQKLKIYWRHLAEQAYKAKQQVGSEWDEKVNQAMNREAGVSGDAGDKKGPDWMASFIATVWKDTPSRWPKAVELQSMNEAAQQEWKERRMVYNRRKEKLQLYLKLHYDYLRIPGRRKMEAERLKRMGLVPQDRPIRGQ